MPEITVPVPDARVADFYQFFGQWLAGTLPGAINAPTLAEPESSGVERQAWSSDDLDKAEWLWRKLSKHAKKMFAMLMDEPGREFTGAEIAKAAEIPNGANGVAGVLAWPGRYCWQLERHMPTSWRDGEDPYSPSVYWMSPEVAELFRAARSNVEQSA